MSQNAAEYRIVFYQMFPELGEKVAVGLLFKEGTDAFLHYDSRLKKVKRLYPDVDPELIKEQLDDFGDDLRKPAAGREAAKNYEPHLTVSGPRQIVLPITQRVIEMLLNRIVRTSAEKRKAKRKESDPIIDSLALFVEKHSIGVANVVREIDSTMIVGRRVGGLASIALGIKLARAWLLLDGVDLRIQTRSQAEDRAEHVARNFWRYQRVLRNQDVNFKRIGLVMNGASHLSRMTAEAHDYAIHRLKMDCDLALDTSRAEDVLKFQEALSG